MPGGGGSSDYTQPHSVACLNTTEWPTLRHEHIVTRRQNDFETF